MKENNFKVIIPVYNLEKEIHRTIWSLFNQSYQNWSCVIINDASHDRSLEVVKRFMLDIPSEQLLKKKRFRVLDRKESVGVFENVQYGINMICEDDEDIILILENNKFTSHNILAEINNHYTNPLVSQFEIDAIKTLKYNLWKTQNENSN